MRLRPTLTTSGECADPNPSQARVDIEVTVRTATTGQLTVYDMNGRKVALLLDEHVTAGTHTATWEAQSAGEVLA